MDELQEYSAINQYSVDTNYSQKEASIFDNIQTAFRAENLAVQGFKAIGEFKKTNEFTPDMNFNSEAFDKDRGLLRNLSPQAQARVGESESEAEFSYKYEREVRNDEAIKNLDDSSASFVYRMTAGIADPVNAVYFAKALNTGSKLLRAVKGAAVEGVAEAGRWKLDEFDERTGTSLVTVMALGGAFNTIGRGFDDNAYLGSKDLHDTMMNNLVVNTKIEAGMKVDPETFKTMKFTTAREIDPAPTPTLTEAREAGFGSISEFVEKWDATTAGLAARSSSKTIVGLSNKLYSYHIGKQNTDSVQDTFSYMKSTLDNQYNMDMKPVMDEWIHGTATPPLYTRFWNPKVHDFNQAMGEAVYKHKELGEPLENFSAIEQKGIKVHTDIMNKSYDLAKENGHPSFQQFAKRDDYFHNAYSPEKLTSLSNTYSRATITNSLEELFTKSIKSQMRNLGRTVDDELTAKVAKGMTDKIVSSKIDKVKGRNNTQLSTADMVRTLKESGADDETISAFEEAIKGTVAKKSNSEGAVKRKTGMDRTQTVMLPDGVEFGFKDITDFGLDSAVTGYTHKIAGRTALHKQGFDDVEINKHLSEADKELKQNPAISTDKKAAEYNRLKATFDYFRGYPTTPSGSEVHNRMATMANALVTAKYLGQTGFTMASELASIAHRNGIKELMRQMPAFKSLWEMYSKGTITNPVYRDLYDVGLAGDILEIGGHSRFDADASIGHSNALLKGEAYSMAARDAVLHLGGIKPLTSLFDMVYGAGVVRKLSNLTQRAKGGKKFSNSDLDDLDALGLSKEDLSGIFKHIDDKGNLLLKDIEDPELYNKVVLGIRRDVDRTVQKSDLSGQLGVGANSMGSDALISQTPLGKLALNLKAYTIGSFHKQLGYMASRRDAMLYTNTMAQIALGSIAYMAQQTLTSGGNQEYLKDRIQPAEVLSKAISRATTASYVPGFAELLAEATDAKELINSAAGRKVFSASPTYDVANGFIPVAASVVGDVITASKGAFGLMNGFDKKDGRKIMGLLPNIVINSSIQNGILREDH